MEEEVTTGPQVPPATPAEEEIDEAPSQAAEEVPETDAPAEEEVV